jgi:hypothetical protein
MNQVIAVRFAMILSATVVLAQSASKPTIRQYTANDGSRAVVTSAGLPGESRIDIYTPHLDKICSLDYSSEDADHGYVVAKASWTPDGTFFVFSLESSGGPSPWHTPTEFVSFENHTRGSHADVCLLDSYLDDPGVMDPDFRLAAPNWVTTRIYAASKDVTVSLGALTSQHPVNGKSSMRSL